MQKKIASTVMIKVKERLECIDQFINESLCCTTSGQIALFINPLSLLFSFKLIGGMIKKGRSSEIMTP